MEDRKKIYIGVDPDVRLINMAIITDQKELLAVMLRRNTAPPGIQATVNAARMVKLLCQDMLAYAVAHEGLDGYQTVMVVEGQSMQHAVQARRTNKNINLDDILQVGQVAGMVMGAFNNVTEQQHLVLPVVWKKTMPKGIHHPRIYKALGIECKKMGHKTNLKEQYAAPVDHERYCSFSHDKINAGDFKDISDSIGLALFGITEGY